MSDAEYRAACERANKIWNAHGIYFTFFFEPGCTKAESAKDLHVHLKPSTGSQALGYSNAAACNTVRDNGTGSPESCGSVIAHEIGHCFGLDNVNGGSRLMGPNAGHPTSEVTAAEAATARQYARRFAVECTDEACDLFRRREKQPPIVQPQPQPPSEDISKLVKRIEDLEKRLADLQQKPGPKGDTGEAGKDGRDGRDGADGKPPTDDVIVDIVRRVVDSKLDQLRGPAGPVGKLRVIVERDDGSVIKEIAAAEDGGVVRIKASKLFSDKK